MEIIIEKLNAAKSELTELQNMIPGLLAIVCLPMRWTWKGWKARKYDGNNNERAVELHDLPLAIAYPIAVFFYGVWKELIGNLTDLTEEEIAAEIYRQLKEIVSKPLMNSGVGSAPLMS